MNRNTKLKDARTYIKDRLSQEELLAQLAEEATELAHAALKLRRALDGTNPTPVHLPTAFEHIREEVADVQLLVQLLGLNNDPELIEDIMSMKLLRWQKRLVEAEV
jgi:NTP pyrophosphatase (non-canonical NTP hydrolase)